MPENLEPLILDLLDWLAVRPRPYAEVMDAWKTSCPRLPVWEQANERGFIRHEHQSDGRVVSASDAGVAHLRAHGRG